MQQKTVKQRREKTPEQALASLMRLCARAEKSEGDARRLMYGWGLAAADAEKVLARLVADRFIDDSRFADAFVREKLRLSGWGVYKIRAALGRKGIDKGRIEAALAQANDSEMTDRLRQQLERKLRFVKAASTYELRTKLIRYGLSLGYEYSTVTDTVAAFIGADESPENFQTVENDNFQGE